jgi:hypothetical protein
MGKIVAWTIHVCSTASPETQPALAVAFQRFGRNPSTLPGWPLIFPARQGGFRRDSPCRWEACLTNLRLPAISFFGCIFYRVRTKVLALLAGPAVRRYV